MIVHWRIGTMNRVYVDEALKSRLDQCATRTEFCDRDGRVLGVYLPEAERERRLYELAIAEMTPERIAELERIAQEKPEGRSLEEILKSLHDS